METQGRMTTYKNEMTEKTDKIAYGRIALIMSLVVILAYTLQYIVSYVAFESIGISDVTVGMIIISFICMYMISLPIGAFLLRSTHEKSKPYERFGINQMVCFFFMSEGVAYIGNAVGTLLASSLSGGRAENAVVALATGNGHTILKLVCLVLIAPLIEEYVFRKLIIDGIIEYDEKSAMLFSALVFGLYHISLYQLFYTTALGLLWAYIYIRTRKVRYTYVLHAALNFKSAILLGTIFPKDQIEILLDVETTEDIIKLIEQQPGIANGIIAVLMFSILSIIFALIGVVLLVINRKKWIFSKSSYTINGRQINRNMFLNMGMATYIIVCISMMGIQLLM